MAASRTECRAFGVVAQENTMSLLSTLRGLSYKYNTVTTKVYEAVLRIPPKNTCIKLQKRLLGEQDKSSDPLAEDLPDRWLMLWESDPVRGPLFKELQVAVREVCESHCYCNNALAFWQDQGAVFEYDMIKKGNEYYCYHDGFEIRVQWFCVYALRQPGNLESGEKSAFGKYVIDVSTRVPEGQHVQGARAIGSFGMALRPLVTLVRADMPVL